VGNGGTNYAAHSLYCLLLYGMFPFELLSPGSLLSCSPLLVKTIFVVLTNPSAQTEKDERLRYAVRLRIANFLKLLICQHFYYLKDSKTHVPSCPVVSLSLSHSRCRIGPLAGVLRHAFGQGNRALHQMGGRSSRMFDETGTSYWGLCDRVVSVLRFLSVAVLVLSCLSLLANLMFSRASSSRPSIPRCWRQLPQPFTTQGLYFVGCQDTAVFSLYLASLLLVSLSRRTLSPYLFVAGVALA
jgi:hypothetical protein